MHFLFTNPATMGRMQNNVNFSTYEGCRAQSALQFSHRSEGTNGVLLYLGSSVGSEKQIAHSMIWTWVTDSISYHDNCYANYIYSYKKSSRPS